MITLLLGFFGRAAASPKPNAIHPCMRHYCFQ